ncbi:hypothetical protein HHI36_001148 [Cryptolaemus montrouzieri]|uniref:Uncharacterized protein n=1 Tax=Cryptolaemus montrouzieri TaxID=559131 RepID=A0ABD2P6S3_9CUCU
MAAYYNTINEIPKGQTGSFNILYLDAQFRISPQKLSVELTSSGNGFEILNKDIPTRTLNNNTGTLIDYAFTNSKLSSKLAIFHEYVCDHRHQMLIVDAPIKRDSGECQNHCVVYDVDKLTFQKKLVEMERRSWDNADDLCNEIIRSFTTSLRRKILKNTSRKNSVPWFNIEIHELVKTGDFHLKRHTQFPGNEYLMNSYKHAQNALKSTITLRKKQYYQDQLGNSEGNPRELRKVLNELVHGKPKKNSKKLTVS